ncbi:Uncharacterized protein YjbI, contains pentapeptide repeats [Pedobacter caeni]|uniref:Uncharacterized protein YjbI, contains pentapeptide repeats n=2 Tax=Pedobacter caeni TaxID=288992 RepID=A0A1M4UKS2_9SPHI|nr:Uncharacterized protein YjbI, contains pentapeptide repeats [Pedobacter caeni]
MIGTKITEARKKKNLSQAQLAQQLFISPQAVGKWERGESMPDIITLNHLAEILDVDLNYFSESMPSQTRELTPFEPLIKPTDELPAENQVKKLSWDMSDGNWLDADFSGLKNLQEKFSSSNMQHCLFIGSELSGLLLKGNNVDSCNFSNSDLSKSHIQNSNLLSNSFKDCSLKEAEFSKSYINGCDFSGADLTGLKLLKSNHADACNFSNSDISNSHMLNSSIANSIFKNCSLKEAEFSKTHIDSCDFSDTNFTGIVFKSGAFLSNAIVNAVWNRSSFIGTRIEELLFEGALEDCYFENCGFKKVTFQNTRLTNTFFKNNSLKRVSFVNCQSDRMTYEFLKGGKVDLTGITVFEV